MRTSPLQLASEPLPLKRGPGAKAEPTPAAKAFNIIEDISVLETRCFQLLRVTPPNGVLYCDSLKTLLNREINWLEWKKELRCVAFEKSAESSGAFDQSIIDKIAGTGAQTQQRSKFLQTGSASRSLQGPYISGLSDNEISSAVKTILKSVASFQEFISPFLEADDPENGIEEEYHPKNDNVYCWRARRLLAEETLRVVEFMGNGDLSCGLKEMKNECLGSLKDIGVFVDDTPVMKTEESEIMDVDGASTEQNQDEVEVEAEAKVDDNKSTTILESKSEAKNEGKQDESKDEKGKKREAPKNSTEQDSAKRHKGQDKMPSAAPAVKNEVRESKQKVEESSDIGTNKALGKPEPQSVGKNSSTKKGTTSK
jgi:THO complex subunit 1